MINLIDSFAGALSLQAAIFAVNQSWNTRTGRCSSARGLHTNQ